jgi:cathepsin C
MATVNLKINFQRYSFQFIIFNGHGPLTCGHSVPDSEIDSFVAGLDDFEVFQTIDVILNNHLDRKKVISSTQLTIRGNQGKWTMIYDEGFELNI